MVTSPTIDEDDNVNEDGAQAAAAAPVRKKSLLLIVSLVVSFVITVFALVGIAIALFTTHADPEAITIPAMSLKDLPAEVKRDTMETTVPARTETPVIDQTTPTDEFTPPQETEQQEETPLDLNASPVKEPSVDGEKKSPLLEGKDESIAPQSMIQWKPSVVLPQGAKPKIAIVIDDMGLNRPNSRRIVALSGKLTLAYLPYADNLQAQADDARAKGHELIVHVPMEPTVLKGNNPGPEPLLTSLAPEENTRRLKNDLSKFEGYVGINNHMGSGFTANADALRPVMAVLKEKGLWFLDSKTIGSSKAAKMAAEYGVPYAERDVFLDNVESVDAVNAQLRQLESIARHKGYAVAIGHPHNATIAALQAWFASGKAAQYDLVPLSAVIALHFPSATVPRYARLNEASAVEPAAGVAAVETRTQQIR